MIINAFCRTDNNEGSDSMQQNIPDRITFRIKPEFKPALVAWLEANPWFDLTALMNFSLKELIDNWEGFNVPTKPKRRGPNKKKVATATEEEVEKSPDNSNATLGGPNVLQPGKPSLKDRLKQQSPTGKTWDAYSEAYSTKYGTEPVRNAQQMGKAKALVARVGQDVAPELVRFYLQHADAWYTRNAHSLGVCLKDAEKLHTEMVVGSKITPNMIKSAEQDQERQQMVSAVMAKRQREQTNT